MGGGGGGKGDGRSTRKIFAERKIKGKQSFNANHAKETFSKKIRAARKFPTLPILNFSNKLSLVSSEGNTTESMVYSR